MCGDDIKGFAEDGVEPIGNFLMENKGVTAGVGLLSPAGPWWLAFLHDFSTVDNDDVQKPQSRLDGLKDIGHGTNPSNVIPEDFRAVSFENVRTMFLGAMVPRGTAEKWGEIGRGIISATQDFKDGLAVLKESGGWKGATHDAAAANVESSLTEPSAAARGAGAMEILMDTWIGTMTAIHTHIHGNWDNYQRDLKAYPEFQDEVKRDYDSFAQKVMGDIYCPNIVEIAKNNPAFTDGGASQGTPAQGGVPTGGAASVGSGPSGGGAGPVGGAGSLAGASVPDFAGPTVPEIAVPVSADQPTVPTLPSSGLSDALGAASGAAQSGLGAATNAAGVPKSGTAVPPEGVLGLGPNGLSGAAGAGKAGTGAGGSGAGASLPRGLATGRPGGTPVSAAAQLSNATRAASAGAGAGAMGPPGAGAPAAAGQRGGESAGHTASKVLRRKKNGQKIAGDSEAVLPVIGAPEKRPTGGSHQPEQVDRTDQPERGSEGVRSAPWTVPSTEHARSSA